MRRMAFSVASLMVFACSVDARQILEFKHDDSQRTTTVTTPTQQLGGKRMNGLLIKVVGIYEGERPTKIKSIGLMIFSVADRAEFETDRKLAFVIDGKRIKLGQMRLAFVEDDSVRYMEGLYISTDLDMLVRLTTSSKVGGTIGGRRFIISEAHREAIKVFVSFFTSTQAK